MQEKLISLVAHPCGHARGTIQPGIMLRVAKRPQKPDDNEEGASAYKLPSLATFNGAREQELPERVVS